MTSVVRHGQGIFRGMDSTLGPEVQCPAKPSLTCDPLQVEGLIKTVVKTTVQETLTTLGIDVSKPFEVQKDMQYLRGWRESSAVMKSKVVTVLVTVIVTAGLTLFVIGFRHWKG